MAGPNKLALIVARRQKRLQYWQERLAAGKVGAAGNTAGEDLSAEHAHEFKEKLGTYALLISKLAKAENETQTNEAERRLLGLERELISLFEARRLMTSDIGVPVVEGYPER